MSNNKETERPQKPAQYWAAELHFPCHRSQQKQPLSWHHCSERNNHFDIRGTSLKVSVLIPKSARRKSSLKAPKHRLQVLLKEQNSPKTPVRKLSTINNLYIRNQKKPLQKTTESIAQYSYRAYPLAKSNNMKLKKMKRKLQHNPAISIVPYPPKQSQRIRKSVLSRHPHLFTRTVPAKNRTSKIENPYRPATHTSKATKYTRTGPALHTAETHTCEYVRDPTRQKNSHEPNRPN
jgi:hypothetical protein